MARCPERPLNRLAHLRATGAGSRRRRAAAGGAMVVAAAFLAACGGSSSGDASTSTSVAATTTSTSATTSTTVATTTTTAATTTSVAQPGCATDGLSVSVGGPTDPGAGSVTYPITFTDTGPSPCTLDGFPGVSAVNAAGQQIGQPAARTTQVATAVTIQPGQSGTALLRVAEAGNFSPSSCGTPTPSAGLRVYPPGQTAAVTATATITVCSGAAIQLQINPITS